LRVGWCREFNGEQFSRSAAVRVVNAEGFLSFGLNSLGLAFTGQGSTWEWMMNGSMLEHETLEYVNEALERSCRGK